MLIARDRAARPGTRWSWSTRCARSSPTCGPSSCPTAVYAASEDWGAEGLAERIDRAGAELARAHGHPPPGAARDTAPDVDTAAALAPRSPTGAITSVKPAARPGPCPFEQRLAALQAE